MRRREIVLKYSTANVCVTYKDSGEMLFRDHNLFTDSGRALVANIFTVTPALSPAFDPSKIVCDLGDNSTTVNRTDLDLGMIPDPFTTLPLASVQLSGTYSIPLSGASSGVHFSFDYTASGSKNISELGLFYRPSSDSFPDRGSVPETMRGTMLARLKSPGVITVADTRTITIDWKIIF